jgi:DNA-binding response OmpR family regulator
LRGALESARCRPPHSHAANVHNARILVVDDNATNLAILEELLCDWGMKSTVVPGAREAFDALRGLAAGRRTFSVGSRRDGYVAKPIRAQQMFETTKLVLDKNAESESATKAGPAAAEDPVD